MSVLQEGDVCDRPGVDDDFVSGAVVVGAGSLRLTFNSNANVDEDGGRPAVDALVPELVQRTHIRVGPNGYGSGCIGSKTQGCRPRVTGAASLQLYPGWYI